MSMLKSGYGVELSCAACSNVRFTGLLKRSRRRGQVSLRRYVDPALDSTRAAIANIFARAAARIATKLRALIPDKKLAMLLKARLRTAEDILQELGLDEEFADLIPELTRELAQLYKEAGIDALTTVGFGNESRDRMFEVVEERALEFARERSAELVGMRIDADGDIVPNPNKEWSITETTRESLRGNIEDAMEEGWSAQNLADTIRDSYAFSEARAEMIARTELAMAAANGAMDRFRDNSDIIGKRSIMADTHPELDICDENAEAGAIPMDADFPSGDQQPPYHPNCLCDIVPVFADDEDLTEEERDLLGVSEKWDESQHERDDAGKFTVMGGGITTPMSRVGAGRSWRGNVRSTLGIKGKFEGNVRTLREIDDDNLNTMRADLSRIDQELRLASRVAQGDRHESIMAARNAIDYARTAIRIIHAEEGHEMWPTDDVEQFVALTEDNRLRGAAIAKFENVPGGEAELLYLGSFQRGAGSALLAEFELWAEAKGAKTVVLTSSKYAEAFYAKHGYQQHHHGSALFRKTLKKMLLGDMFTDDYEDEHFLLALSPQIDKYVKKVEKWDESQHPREEDGRFLGGPDPSYTELKNPRTSEATIKLLDTIDFQGVPVTYARTYNKMAELVSDGLGLPGIDPSYGEAYGAYVPKTGEILLNVPMLCDFDKRTVRGIADHEISHARFDKAPEAHNWAQNHYTKLDEEGERISEYAVMQLWANANHKRIRGVDESLAECYRTNKWPPYHAQLRTRVEREWKASRAAKGDWNEEDHPRDDAGRFAGGAGGAGSDASAPSRDDQRKSAEGITQFVTMIDRIQQPPAGYQSHASVLKELGQPFEMDDATFAGRRGTQHQCYANAGRIALMDDDVTYCEGYVSIHGVPIEHAWLINKAGKVVDPTINPKRAGYPLAYYGVKFKTEYLRQTILKTKVWGLMDGLNNPSLYRIESRGDPFAKAEWDESLHPRDDDGRFGDGSGSGSEEQVHSRENIFSTGRWGAMGMDERRAEWGKLSQEERDAIANPNVTIPARVAEIAGDESTWPDTGNMHEDINQRIDKIGASYLGPEGSALTKDFAHQAHDDFLAAGASKEDARALTTKMVDHLVAQDYEATGRTLGDHGIHHLLGDTRLAIDILSEIPGGHNTPENRALMALAGAFHDTGYLTPPAQAFLDGDHPRHSALYFDESIRPLAEKAFGPNFGRDASQIIYGHDQTNIDWENEPLLSAFSTADNLALFHKEKMPNFLRYAPANIGVLIALGRGSIDVPTAKIAMRANIDGSDMSHSMKLQAMRAVDEVSGALPKFTLGMIGTRLDNVKWKGNALEVNISRHTHNKELSKVLDMGQRQFKKLAETYGGDLNEFMRTGSFEFQRNGRAVLRARISNFGKVLLSTLLDKLLVDDRAHTAASSPHNDLTPPTRAQANAGNYKKGEMWVGGLRIRIENPAGSTREGADWSQLMEDHYGYFSRTEGKDGDHVDVFVKPGMDDDWRDTVYVVDQYLDNEFDEHKCMLGYDSLHEARAAYCRNYPIGWNGHRAITAVPFSAFKAWLFAGNTRKPMDKWDDSQHPRADDGKFTDDGGSGAAKKEKMRQFYHGTAPEYVDSILQSGLQVIDNRNWPDEFFEDERGEMVFVATKFEDAEEYARTAGNQSSSSVRGEGYTWNYKAAVITFEVPESVYKTFKKDKEDRSSRMTPRLDSKYIKEYRIYDGQSDGGPEPSRWEVSAHHTVKKVDERIVRLYVVKLFSDQAEKWDESQHPRDDGGRFTDGGMSYDSGSKSWLGENGKPVSAKVAARIKAAGVPPAWTGVQLNLDPNAPLQARGYDSKGRLQSRYSKEHSETASAEKFSRLKEFTSALPKVREGINRTLADKSNPPQIRDAAAALALIDQTGIRVGGEKETGATTKSYGATTLLGKHITLGPGGRIDLSFPGKSGKVNVASTTDKVLSGYLRSKNAGPNDRVFEITDAKVRSALENIAGDRFSPKDFRTYKGTATAIQKIQSMPRPKSAAEFKRFRMDVARHVAGVLNNTPSMALNSYIDPAVFGKWKFNGSSIRKQDPSLDELMEEFVATTSYNESGDWRNEPLTDQDEDEIEKWDESQHPRDDGGRFGFGDGHVYGPLWHMNPIQASKLIYSEAEKIGLPKDDLVIVMDRNSQSENHQKYIAYYDSANNYVTFNAFNINISDKPAAVRGIVRHEFSHYSLHNCSDDIVNYIDKNMTELSADRKNISEYADTWWARTKYGLANQRQAVDETLAECNTLNKWPPAYKKLQEEVINNLGRRMASGLQRWPIRSTGAMARKVDLGGLLKYSDDQPRDDGGRWTSGGGETYNIGVLEANEAFFGYVTNRAQIIDEAKLNDIPIDRVDIYKVTKKFSVNGERFLMAGQFDTKKGRIALYPANFERGEAVGIIAHEATHYKDHAIEEATKSERAVMTPDMFESPGGLVRQPLQEKYPLMTIARQNKAAEKQLIDEADRISSYARSYAEAHKETVGWALYPETASRSRAALIGEAHAEVVKNKREGAHPLTISQAWNDYHERQVKAWEIAKKRGWATFGKWDESQHPRDDNGRFGDGGGDAPKTTQVSSMRRERHYPDPTMTVSALNRECVEADIPANKVRISDDVHIQEVNGYKRQSAGSYNHQHDRVTLWTRGTGTNGEWRGVLHHEAQHYKDAQLKSEYAKEKVDWDATPDDERVHGAFPIHDMMGWENHHKENLRLAARNISAYAREWADNPMAPNEHVFREANAEVAYLKKRGMLAAVPNIWRTYHLQRNKEWGYINPKKVDLGGLLKGDWDESQHPRDDNGRFGDGGGRELKGLLYQTQGAKLPIGRIKEQVTQIVKEAGIDGRKVVVHESQAAVNQHMRNPNYDNTAPIARYNWRTGKLEFNGPEMRQFTAVTNAGIARHEVAHVKFHNAELNSKAVRDFIDKNGEALRREGQDTTEYSAHHWKRADSDVRMMRDLSPTVKERNDHRRRAHQRAIDESLAEQIRIGKGLTKTYRQLNTMVETQWSRRKTKKVDLGGLFKGDWDESQHPRGDDGKFSDGGGSDDEWAVTTSMTGKVAREELSDRFAALAQEEYDAWDPSNIDEYAGGGICHFIAERIADDLSSRGINATTVTSNYEQHVYVIAQLKDGVYEVDVPYSQYERGGGFSWEKLPGAKFDASSIVISRIDSDPRSFDQYLDKFMKADGYDPDQPRDDLGRWTAGGSGYDAPQESPDPSIRAPVEVVQAGVDEAVRIGFPADKVLIEDGIDPKLLLIVGADSPAAFYDASKDTINFVRSGLGGITPDGLKGVARHEVNHAKWENAVRMESGELSKFVLSEHPRELALEGAEGVSDYARMHWENFVGMLTTMDEGVRTVGQEKAVEMLQRKYLLAVNETLAELQRSLPQDKTKSFETYRQLQAMLEDKWKARSKK